MLKISVLIITRNRDKDLDECLKSLVEQSKLPFEIIIVDNGSSDKTRIIFKKYQKVLPIKYYLEKRIGIPYARNKSIKKSKGNILAFIDDDCVASEDWIEIISKNFEKDKKLDALAGLSKSYWQEPVPLVEQVYYERWIHSVTGTLTKKTEMEKNRFFDFKNCVIKKNTLEKMPKLFSTKVPFGDVGDEDTEFVRRFNDYCKKALFDPRLRVAHKNSRNVSRLFIRNFYHGISQYLLFSKKDSSFDTKGSKVRVDQLFELLPKNLKLINSSISKLVLLVLVLIYPIAYKSGRIYAGVFLIPRGNYTMPSR